jgi:hypothetical protein
MTEKGSSIVKPLTLAVAESTTLNVPASLKTDPKKTILVPSTWMKDGSVFNVYRTESPQAGL